MAALPSCRRLAAALTGVVLLTAHADAVEPDELAGLWITDGEDGTAVACPAAAPPSGPRCDATMRVYETLRIDGAGGFTFGYGALEADVAVAVSSGRVSAAGAGDVRFDFSVEHTFDDGPVLLPGGPALAPWLDRTQRRTVLVAGDRMTIADEATGEARFYTRYPPEVVESVRDVLATAEIAPSPAWRAVAACIADTDAATGDLPPQQAAFRDYLDFADETRDWDMRTAAALAGLAAGQAEQATRAAALEAAPAGERDRLRAEYDRFMRDLSDREQAAALTFQEWSATVLLDEAYQRRNWLARVRAAGVEPVAALSCQIGWDTLDRLLGEAG